ncbi:MAG: hypothetical protein LBI06_09235 [Treponema sp.]|nr:hypothetical protein [Treponema sp.]
MKNPLCFIFALMLALAFAGCPDDGSKGGEEPLVLDQRLVGGKWFQMATLIPERVYRLTENKYNGYFASGFFEFTNDGEDSFFFSENTYLNKDIYTDDELNSLDNAVYSKNGTIYWKHNSKKLMDYEFQDAFPYPDTADSSMPSSLRRDLNRYAADGNLITYRLYRQNGSIYRDDANFRFRYGYLIRATEYEDY